MLTGEHAVLHGKHALCASVNGRITAKLTPRYDDTITITSSLGTHETSRFKITVKPPFTFICDAIYSCKHLLPSGFDLEITSEISPLFGLGTSAAVTVSTIGALLSWLQGSYTHDELFIKSVQTIRNVQKRGSGADVAASVYGGCVLYKMDPLTIEPIDAQFDLTVIYSKSKMKTPEVIKVVQENMKHAPKLFETLFSAIDDVTLEAKRALKDKNLKRLGKLFNIHQGLHDALGVNSHTLSEIVYALRDDEKILGAKISGSGLGDCVIGLGKAENFTLDYPILNVQMSKKGVLS